MVLIQSKKGSELKMNVIHPKFFPTSDPEVYRKKLIELLTKNKKYCEKHIKKLKK
jgi:hypothetical protein